MARPTHRRYLSLAWEEVRMRSGMTDQEITYGTQARYAWASKAGHSRKSILSNRLDNPFMKKHAINTILADMRKAVEARTAGVWRTKITRKAWGVRQRERRAA